MATALYTLRQMVGESMGSGLDAEMITGVPTGTLSTTGFACSTLDQYEDSYFIDWTIHFYTGTHKDITRTVTAFTGSTGVIVFSPAVTGAVDGTDYFELHRDFSPSQINSKINLAIMMVETEYLTDKVNESIVVNDLLTDGLFEVWTTSSVLTNYTTGGTGTLARESTIKREGTYSAKLTNTIGNAFYIYQSLNNTGLYAGKTASLYARANTSTADRVRISLTDGVTTWYSSYHGGQGWLTSQPDGFLKIENVTVSNSLTELTASFRIETGAAISAYVDKMYLVCGDTIYEYTVPTGFYTIENIYQEQLTIGQFSRKYDLISAENGWSFLINGTTKKIWFDPNIASLSSGRKLRIEGQSKASQLTLDADTTDVPPAYIVQQATALLHQALITGNDAVSQRHQTQMAMAQTLANIERPKCKTGLRGFKVDS